MKKLFKAISLIAVIALLAGVLAFSLVACDGKNDTTLRFAAPDGTPALAMLTLASEGQKLGGKTVDYEVVSPSNIATEMTSGKADIVIMPVNAGATQIVKNGVDYKLISIAVEGSLYLVGHKEADGAGNVPDITINDIKGKKIACIGEQGVPGLVFKYVMSKNGITIVTDEAKKDALGENEVFVEYVADGSVAAQRYKGGMVDFIVVGEPAATAQKANKDNNINAEMNMQTEYAKANGTQGVDDYPQAGLFVKTALTQDTQLMKDLFAALDRNEDWIEANADKVTAEAEKIGSTSKFPAPAIPRCALDCSGLDAEDVSEILAFLNSVVPAVKWEEGKDKLFALGLAG